MLILHYIDFLLLSFDNGCTLLTGNFQLLHALKEEFQYLACLETCTSLAKSFVLTDTPLTVTHVDAVLSPASDSTLLACHLLNQSSSTRTTNSDELISSELTLHIGFYVTLVF